VRVVLAAVCVIAGKVYEQLRSIRVWTGQVTHQSLVCNFTAGSMSSDLNVDPSSSD
jgi:hypothetical protein